MGGFSQGALMTRAAIKQLPIAVMDKISAIALWGDPGMLKIYTLGAFGAYTT
jgi:hypothetical protein